MLCRKKSEHGRRDQAVAFSSWIRVGLMAGEIRTRI